MDTYWSTEYSKCKECLECVMACMDDGDNVLWWNGYTVEVKYDYVPCHHCTEHFKKKGACEQACENNAIKIERT